MHVVDGSAGGGQLVRTAATLAALAEEPVRAEHARASRDPPGLKAQHVAAIEAIAGICDADTSGVAVGATTFDFDPDTPRGGDYAVDVGTAGSIMLVFDTVLPLATAIDSPLSLTVTGGTDVEWAPTLDFYRHAKLPLLRDVGLNARLSVERRGFYPAGGGRVTLHLEPSTLAALDVVDRGPLQELHVRSTAGDSLADADVAERQADAAVEELPDDAPVETTVEYVDARSPGSVLDVIATYEHSRAGFSSLGRRGTPAEAAGTTAVEEFIAFQASDAAVDRHLADQLLPFLALAGGRLHAPTVTNHVETSVDLIQQFGYDVAVDSADGVLLTTR